MRHGMNHPTGNVIRHGLPYSPSPLSNPLVERFSSIVQVVEGDKRMAAGAAKIRGLR
jgi:hypothetical protein